MIIYRGLKRRKLHDFITLSFYRETLFPFVFYSGFSVYFLSILVQHFVGFSRLNYVLLNTEELERFVQLVGLVVILLVSGTRILAVLRHSSSSTPSIYGMAVSYAALVLCVWYDTPHSMAFLLFASVHAALITKKRNAPLAILFAGAVFIVLLLNDNLMGWFIALVSFALLKSLFYVAENYDLLYRRAAERLNATTGMVANLTHENTQLHEKFEVSVKNIVTAERTRIAREIHDTIGHSLTTLLRQVEILGELNKQTKNGERPQGLSQAKQIKEFESVIRKSIDDMRREVSSLRTEREPVDWLKSCEILCDTFSKCSQVDVKFVLYSAMPEIADRIGRSVYRIIQESLTNSLRHGHADDVLVMMGLDGDRRTMYLKVSDNGLGSIKVRPGNGLNGIVERTQQLSGYVAWRTEYMSGFDLGVEIPLVGEDEKRN